MTPEQMVSRLLYRDGLMLVIDKPAGFAVHRRGPKGGESLEDHFDALRFRPAAVAGARASARSPTPPVAWCAEPPPQGAGDLLGRLFKSGAVEKTYRAVVEGAPATDEGTIEFSLGRLDETRGWWMKHDPNGQPAVTKWKVLGSFCPSAAGEGKTSWLALEPLTGRDTSIAQCIAPMGWPIVGDAIYGDAPRSGGPVLHLHAREVVVPLYKNRSAIRVVAPVPPHMRTALGRCGWKGEESNFKSRHSGARAKARRVAIHNHER